MKAGWDRLAWPWLAGLVIAAALCSSYPFMFACRKAWQGHSPRLAASWANNGGFTVLGVYGTGNGFEELAYAARANAAAVHWVPFDPFIKENHSRRILVSDYLTYRLIGLVQVLFRDISWTWIFVQFWCCFWWFVLVYKMVLGLTGSRELSFFGAVFVSCQSYLLTLIFVSRLQWGLDWPAWIHNAWTVLSYGRTESVCRLPRPGLTYTMLFAATLLTARSAGRKGLLWPAVAGVFGGSLAYIRADVYTIYLAASWIFAAIHCWKNGWRCSVFLAPALSSALGLPWMAVTFPLDPDFVARFWEPNSSPYLWALVYLAGAGLLIRRTAEPLALFIASVLIGDAVILNLRIVTGHSISPFNWAYVGNIYLFIGALLLLPAALRQKKALWVGAGTALAACALLQNLFFAAVHYPFYGLPQDYEAALAWIGRNSPRDSVVLTFDPEIVGLIPAYTRCKVPLAYPFAMVSDLSIADNAARLLAVLDFFGVERDRFLREFWQAPQLDRRTQDQADRRAVVKLSLVASTFFHQNPRGRTLRSLDEAARRPAALPDFDYVWFGDFERHYADPRFASRHDLKEVYRNPSIVLYAKPRPSGGG
jgi:hypothetical protein